MPGPHHDQRLKEAANFVLKKWEKERKERQTNDQQPPSKKGKLDNDHEDQSRSDEDIISGIYRIRESSFNMTRGVGENEDIETRSLKF